MAQSGSGLGPGPVAPGLHAALVRNTGYLISRCGMYATRHFAERMEVVGLTPRMWGALNVLDVEGSVSQQQLARRSAWIRARWWARSMSSSNGSGPASPPSERPPRTRVASHRRWTPTLTRGRERGPAAQEAAGPAGRERPRPAARAAAADRRGRGRGARGRRPLGPELSSRPGVRRPAERAGTGVAGEGASVPAGSAQRARRRCPAAPRSPDPRGSRRRASCGRSARGTAAAIAPRTGSPRARRSTQISAQTTSAT